MVSAASEQTNRPPTGRQGPRPLGLHLALAAWTWTSSIAALPMARQGSLRWDQSLRERADALAPLLAAADPAVLTEAIGRTATERLGQLLAAIERYRQHPYRRDLDDGPVLWSSGSTRLLDLGQAAAARDAPVALFVPSLVNRSYILDLSRRRSLLRYLAQRGLRPLLLDWGEVGAAERGLSLDDYVGGRLAEALAVAGEVGGRPARLVGYCMGGNLALAASLLRPAQVHSLALLATPWDFHADMSPAARALVGPASPLIGLVRALGEMPVDALQTLFVSLDPLLGLHTFRGFAETQPGSAAEENFVAIEDWLNDGVSLAGPVALACLIGWYGDNEPARLRWRVAGQTVDPAGVRCPTAVFVPHRDRIVPPASAQALAERLPSARTRVFTPHAGHIGMVVGSRAETELWQPLADWLMY
ncbi:MAG: alpha/beta fold hydrolase [Alphaproteobacteria bacterium]|nr:alpha/beta fold hydrolase [Alphaproteobacteria bacterium]